MHYFDSLHSFVSQVQFLEHFSYAGVFFGVLLSGHVVPIPEDVLLLLAGYLVAGGFGKLIPMILISIAAPIVTDSIFYWLARTGNKLAVGLEHKIRGSVFERYVKAMKEQTFSVVFLSRFLPGFRFASPLVAGFAKIPYKIFLAYNAFGALFYGPLFVLAGYVFHTKVAPLITAIEKLRHVIFVCLLGAFAVGVWVVLSRKFFKKSTILPL
jgi:membrane protein DedA with SNARE-associated domain